MNNIQKWILIACAVLMSIGILFYFVFFLPNQAKKAEYHRKVVECQKIAETAVEHLKKDNPSSRSMSYRYDYTCHYNKKLDRCYYAVDQRITAIFNEKLTSEFFYILMDGYSNYQIAYLRSRGESESENEYKAMVEKYRKELKEKFELKDMPQ